MKIQIRTVFFSFVVGGAYGAIGELLFLGYGSLLGQGSPYQMPAVLISLGILGFVLYVTGLHQKIASFSGYGSILPFNGFACAVANAYESEAGPRRRRLWAGIKQTLFVMGIGAVLVLVVSLVVEAL